MAIAAGLVPFAGVATASASCIPSTTGYQGAVAATAGLVGYWRLGETSGTTACDSGPGGNTGTYKGGYTLGQPGAITGDTNTSVHFDGNTGAVSVPDASSLDLGDTFTIEGWVKLQSLNAAWNMTVLSKQAGSFMLMLNASHQVVLRRSTVGDVSASTVAISDLNWHYVAATKNGSSVHLYLDGNDVTGPVSNHTMANNSNALMLGESSSTAEFYGNLDEVALYRSALTATQIQDHYAAGTQGTATVSPSPTPPTNGDPVIGAAGDIACDPGDPNFKRGKGTATACQQLATSKLVIGTGLTGVLTLGDEQYDDGTLSKFNQVYDSTWGLANNLAHPGVGNHEYLTSGAKGYFDYFDGVGVNSGPAGPRGKGWYSFDLGTWHIIALNSNCSDISGGCAYGSPQETWLRQDLAAHANYCTLAFMHHPRFSSGIAGNISELGQFITDLYDSNADLVLAGHDHDYERFAPQTPGKVNDPAHGIREFVVGTGGKSQKGFDTPQPNSEVRHTGTFGVLRLTLHPSSYDWKFMPVAGQTWTDQGTQSCH